MCWKPSPHSSPAAVTNLAVCRRCSSLYVWIPAEVLYDQHQDDRIVRTALHQLTRFISNPQPRSSGKPRGLLPQLDLGITTLEEKVLFYLCVAQQKEPVCSQRLISGQAIFSLR